MIRKFLTLACSVLCSLSPVPAADQPLDAGQFPEDQYRILVLSEKQLEEVELRRRVTLSKEQQYEFSALAPSFPKTVGVVSPFVDGIPRSRFTPWPDQVTGIWYCRDKVAFSLDSLDGREGYREFRRTLHTSDAVLVDTQGGYSIGARKVDSGKLIHSLNRLARMKPPGTDFEIFILRPPVLGDEGQEQVVREAVEDLGRLCRERGLEYHIGG